MEVACESDLQNGFLGELLKNNLEKDRLLQRTTSGPHRDDLLLIMDGQPVKKFASQGQIKILFAWLRLTYAVPPKKKVLHPFCCWMIFLTNWTNSGCANS